MSIRQAERLKLLQLCLPDDLISPVGCAYVIEMKNFKMIDYDHLQGDRSCNGNLSDVEGGYEAHWTFGSPDGTATEAPFLTGRRFALLWDGIAASLGGDGVFGRCLVTDPTRLVDPASHHVITTTQVRDGRVLHRTFMVPTGESDPAFLAWLDALGMPGSMDRGGPATAGRNRVFTVQAGQARAASRRDTVPA